MTFDAQRYRIATDALVEAGFADVAEWAREKIRDEERRLDLRRVAVDRILRQLTPAVSTGPPYLLHDEVRDWLRDVPGLVPFLQVEVHHVGVHLAVADVLVRMRVTIAGHDWAFQEVLPWGQPGRETLDRCYDRLLALLGNSLALV